MPVYLVHGFRWDRVPIRHHIILNNVEDAAPEYLQNPDTTVAVVNSLRTKYPEIMKAVPTIRFIEQYDPSDTSFSAQSQPYAYVCDTVHQANLNIDVADAMSKAMPAAAWDAMADLRDAIAPNAKLGWWVVYNGDEERASGTESRPTVCRCFFSLYRRYADAGPVEERNEGEPQEAVR